MRFLINALRTLFEALGVKGEGGFWGPVVGGLISAGAGFLGGNKKDGETELKYGREPKEYEESKGARGEWWDKLQQWGEMPGYGAISPDWGEIWERAKRKVGAYFKGTPTSTGLYDKLKASGARRNVSDSPAMDKMLLKAQAEESGQLRDVSSDQALAEAQFGETGRQNWMQQIMQLSGLQRPQAQAYTQTTGGEGNNIADMVSGLGGAVGEGISDWQNKNWMEKMYEKMFASMQPTTT